MLYPGNQLQHKVQFAWINQEDDLEVVMIPELVGKYCSLVKIIVFEIYVVSCRFLKSKGRGDSTILLIVDYFAGNCHVQRLV